MISTCTIFFNQNCSDCNLEIVVRPATVPIDRNQVSKMCVHESQWISHKMNFRHPGQLKK